MKQVQKKKFGKNACQIFFYLVTKTQQKTDLFHCTIQYYQDTTPQRSHSCLK